MTGTKFLLEPLPASYGATITTKGIEMALIKCHECGKDVSTEAAACPHCGAKPKQDVAAVVSPAKQPLNKFQIIGGLVIGIAVIWWIASGDGSSSANNSAASSTPELKPEMVVAPVHGGFLVACQTKELLEELFDHRVRQEKTKFTAMFENLRCFVLPETEKFKVLSLSGGAVEILNVKSNNLSVAVWAPEESFAPVK